MADMKMMVVHASFYLFFQKGLDRFGFIVFMQTCKKPLVDAFSYRL